MKADTLTVKKIFGKDIRYLVPLFQRPYVWTKEDHWEPLWVDVTNVAERLLAELSVVDPNDAAIAEEQTPPHFLGAVVVDQVKNVVAEIETRNVIDGQQRLTTLQVLIDAAQAVIAGLGDKRAAKLLSKLIVNDEDVIAEPDHTFKIWPTNVDQDAFRAVMHDGGDPAAFADSPIVQAHEFFTAAAVEWITEGDGPAEQERRIGALSTTLQGLLHVVVIDLEAHDNAQVIFETLNARGTPLLASDLIKNLVLQTAQQRRMDVQKLYDRYWRDFDERDYWRKDVRQGRLTRSRIDVFLFYWLVMRKAQEVGTQDVFPTFRRYLADKANEVESVLADLDRCGDTFKRLDEIPPHTDDGTFVYRWRVLDAQALTPAVLWLFDQPPDVLASAERTRALRAIESFLVRRTICRLTTKGYNTLFLDLLTKMAEGPAAAGARIEQYLREQTADARLWPSDEQLREAFLTVPVYSLLTRGRLRMVLEALEDSYRSPKSESQFVERGTLTIEHILPQSWQANWPLDVAEGDTPETAALRRERLLHSIGNLTLVTGSLNTPMSNNGWDFKRGEVEKHSVLHLNKRILEMKVEAWGEATIAQRARELAERAIEVWPR